MVVISFIGSAAVGVGTDRSSIPVVQLSAVVDEGDVDVTGVEHVELTADAGVTVLDEADVGVGALVERRDFREVLFLDFVDFV